MSHSPLESYLDDFGQELTRVSSARRLLPTAAPSGRGVALAVLLLAAIVATALAASGVLNGSPVKDPWGDRVKPSEGIGAVVATSAHLSALRVADPAGGLPWGMRILKTTRHAGCVQVGRVRDGQLGVLGRDGAFDDDGLFHPLGPEVASRSDCQPLDGAGKLYLAMSWQGLPASAWPRGCVPSATYTSTQRLQRARGLSMQPRCPAVDQRIVYYGTLGSDALSVTYRDEHRQIHTQLTSGLDGAYLVVTRPSPSRPARGSFLLTTSPASGLVSVAYRDGHRCVIPNPTRLGGAVACPLVGYVEPTFPTVPHRPSRVVTATFSAHPIHPLIGPPPGTPSPDAAWKLTISFHAPVATPNASSYYMASLRPMAGPMATCRSTGFGPIARSLQRGQIARTVFYVSPSCHGPVSGTVVFHHSGRGRRGDQMPFSGVPFHDPVVGHYSAKIPSRP